MSNSMEEVPSTSNDITADWLSKVLNIEMKPDTLECIPGIENRTGSLSSMTRIRFQNVNDSKENCRLIAKLLPIESEASAENRELVIHEKMDLIEINFYKIIVPEILKQVPELESYLCPFIYGNIKEGEEVSNGHKNASVIILKDLLPEGYKNKAFHEQTTLEEFDQGIDFLAKFHFAALAVEYDKKKTLPDAFPWFPDWYKSKEPSSNKRLIIHEWFPVRLDHLNKFLPEKNRYAFVDLKKSAGNILNKVLEAGQEFPTCLHGSLWQNNILFDLSDEKKNIKVIDWQMMGYSDGMFDLAIYILSSFPEEQLSILSVELTVLKYVEEFNKRLDEKTESEGKEFKASLKCRKDFHETLQFFNTYGLAYAFIWFTLSCDSIITSTPENIPKLVNIFRFLHDDMDLPAFLWSIIA